MNRGEVWQVAFDTALGEEIRKTRPAVIVSSNSVGTLNLRVVVPLTTWQPRFARAGWMVRVDPSLENGLSTPSAADAFQVKSVSVQRLRGKIGVLSPDDLQLIIAAVALVIEHT